MGPVGRRLGRHRKKQTLGKKETHGDVSPQKNIGGPDATKTATRKYLLGLAQKPNPWEDTRGQGKHGGGKGFGRGGVVPQPGKKEGWQKERGFS